MPRLVGAQNPHRKVPRTARGGTHGVRVSQSSQHPSQTRPLSSPRLSLSATAFSRRSLSHSLPDLVLAGGKGRQDLIFLFNGREGNMPFVKLEPHKESGGMIRSRRPQVPARPAPARHRGGSCGRPCARWSSPAGGLSFPPLSAGAGGWETKEQGDEEPLLLHHLPPEHAPGHHHQPLHLRLTRFKYKFTNFTTHIFFFSWFLSLLCNKLPYLLYCTKGNL
ncbi:uncharacterized protein LOC115302309 [Suricata suricatta]|uniref:uncharacterized protein LOC115302309 n=1 Tax=Suricata suricatta TaxID=37032 RepID=UPI0011559D69|nr:uncharacterized protein LOC115302309 [Suricata suricatta]